MPVPSALLPALALLAGQGATDDPGGTYLELGAGLASQQEIEATAGSADFETGYSLDVLLGYQWREAWDTRFDFSLEVEGYYSKVGFDDPLLIPNSSQADYLSNGGVVLGGVIDWPCSDEISFYGGAGVGLATSMKLETKGDASSDAELEDDSALLFQGKLGARYAMAENLAWFIQYKYRLSEELTATDAFLDESFDFEIEQHTFEIGMRWGF
jgi:opacity protein-like surface antigen